MKIRGDSRLLGRQAWSGTLCLIAGCLMLAGCGETGRSSLAGKWELESAAQLVDRIGGTDSAGVGGGGDASATGESQMVIEFSANGDLKTATRIGAIDRTKTGTWEIVEWDEAKQVMKIRCVLAGQESEHEVEFLEEGVIRLTPPNMAGTRTKLVFRRAN